MLLSQGYSARLSDSRASWDIELILPHKIERIQVKSGFWDGKKWSHTFAKGRGKNKPYSRGDFDSLVLDGPDGELYLIPTDCLFDSTRTKGQLPKRLTNSHIKYQQFLVYGCQI